jgi:hypothetical protein
MMGALILLGVALPAAGAAGAGGPRAGSPFTTGATNRAAARGWAARLLSELRLPGGAVSSPGAPPGTGRALGAPGFSLTGPELVDATSWWTVDEPPAAVVAFVRAHLPRDRSIVARGVGGEPGRVTDGFWSFSAPAGLRQLTAAIQTDILSRGRTAVRLDGEATWLVPRPSWDRIPASVRSVTYTARAINSGSAGAVGSRGGMSAPRTLGRRDAQRLAAAINRLQRMQPGVAYSCPFDPVQPRITLRFRGADGHPLAVAVDAPSGCATIGLSVAGHRGPALDDMAAARPIQQRMVALGAIRRCRSAELVAGPASLALAAHHPTLTLSVRDRSDAVCIVRGFPRVALLGFRGRTLAGRRTEIAPDAARRAGISGAVILYPGHADAVAARVVLPRVGGALRAVLATSGRHVTPCPDALLRVSAFTPAL